MNRPALRPLVISLGAATVIFGLILLLPAKLMDGYDLARMHQCYKSDLRSALLAGEFPWWNPYTALGRPFFADIETATLYPPSWLVVPFGVTGGILLMIWLHLGLAVEGARRLGEQLGLSRTFATVAGISFALSGALLGRIQSGQLQVFCVVCLWPWVWWSALRLQDEPGVKPVVRTAAWLALAFLAGSPQILWCGLVALGALLVARCVSLPAVAVIVGRLTAAGTLAAGLVAVQLLPFIELVQEGNRPLGDTNFATRAGVTLSGWLTLLLPPGTWGSVNGEYNLHTGILFVALACVALVTAFRQHNARALAAAGLAGLLLALGDRTFVLPRLAEWLPGFASVRYPSRYALATVLTATLLAVWWLDRAFQQRRLGRTVVLSILALHASTLLVGLWVQGEIYRVPAAPANEPHLIADLEAEGLPRDGAPPRVALPASILRADAGAQCGVSTLTGFNSPALARTWTALYLMAGQPPPDFHRAEVADDIIVTLGAQQRYFSLSATSEPRSNVVHFAAPPVPRAFLSFAARRVAGWPEAVTKIRAGHDFVREALVENELTLTDDPPGLTGRASIVAFGRNRIAVDYHTPARSLLVLAEPWYPGWTAKNNDNLTLEVLPVNGWMRGVVVPAGAGRVVLKYQPTSWRLGLWTSVFSFGLAIVLWRLPSGRNRRA